MAESSSGFQAAMPQGSQQPPFFHHIPSISSHQPNTPQQAHAPQISLTPQNLSIARTIPSSHNPSPKIPPPAYAQAMKDINTTPQQNLIHSTTVNHVSTRPTPQSSGPQATAKPQNHLPPHYVHPPVVITDDNVPILRPSWQDFQNFRSFIGKVETGVTQHTSIVKVSCFIELSVFVC